VTWAQRAADRSPTVQRSRVRSIQQAQQMVDAAHRLIAERGEQWTTQELAKEAGVAIQTFYRYFSSKDQLLLAVLEDLHTQSVEQYTRAAEGISDPLARLRKYVMLVFASISDDDPAGRRFVTAQHWRLHQLFPHELAQAVQPFTDMLAEEIRQAQLAGQLAESDPAWAASFVTRLVRAEYHFYAFAQTDAEIDEIAEQVWAFCLNGLGGTDALAATPTKVRARR
jgi:AcrR family transcriptional regulator